MFSCLSAAGQQVVTTFAGNEWAFPAGGPAINAPLSTSVTTAIDTQGRVLFADSLNGIVGRIEAPGTISVIAGNGIRGFSGDGGSARDASLNSPTSVVADRSGNIYVADSGNRRIRRITPAGIISTYGGSLLGSPNRLAIDSSGAVFFTDGARVRRIGTDLSVTIVAGNGMTTFTSANRPATEVAIAPYAIAVDPSGRLLISDIPNRRIYRVASDGILSVIAGTGAQGFSGDGGPATAATFTNVQDITTDADGNILLADTSNGRLRRINSAGILSTIAGGGSAAITTTPSNPLGAAVGLVTSVSADAQGRIFLGEATAQRILQLSADGRAIQHVAGNSRYKEILPNTPAVLATLSEPYGLAIGPDGTVFTAEISGHRITGIHPVNGASRIAGVGVATCCSDNGPAVNGRLNFPAGLAVGPDGALIIADSGNQQIRRVANGVLTLLAGRTFTTGFGGDGGPARDALFNGPFAVAVDRDGNIFIADRFNYRVRRIDRNGIISTYAGNGRGETSGDGGPAISAGINVPNALAFNSGGELLIGEYFGNRVRVVGLDGVIRTLATNVERPLGLATDSQGNVYASQDGRRPIVRIAPSGAVVNFAGTAAAGFSGDGGAPLAAAFNQPGALAFDANGSLFIADSQNNRIRVIRSVAISATLSPAAVAISAVTGSAATVPINVTVSTPTNGLPFSTSVTYAQQRSNWLTVTASNASAPATLTLSADATDLPPGTYNATVTVTTNPAGASNPVTVVLTVADAPARLQLSTEAVSFNRTEGGKAESTIIELRNSGGGSLTYQVSVLGSWLRVSPSTGQLRAGQAAGVTLTADPAGLKPGTYSTPVNIVAGALRATVPVTMIVSAGRPTLLVSQSGLTFTAIAGGGSPSPQQVGILNTGTGVLDWKATTRGSFVRLPTSFGTVSEPWIEVSEFPVSVNSAGLAPGQYYEQIEITAVADNSPQLITVLLDVLPEGSQPGPEVSPAAMIFVSRQGDNPNSQAITFNHLGRGPATYESSRIGNWYEAAPGSGRALPDAPGRIVIQPVLAGLSPGVRRGAVTFQVQEDGAIRNVNLLSVVAPPDAGIKSARAVAACPAPQFQILSTVLRGGFSVRTGDAVTLEVKVVDECGNLLTPLADGNGASVSAISGNGDPRVALVHIGNGVWRGTWRPVRPNSNTTLKFVALYFESLNDLLSNRARGGELTLSGAVLSSAPTAAPLVTAAGVVHSASFESGVPIAPGSLITIYGERLAESAGSAAGAPLPFSLNGAEVRLGNRPLPLLFSSGNQLNAQVPYDIGVDTLQQISIARGGGQGAIAVPETLNVATARPGVFTKSQTGAGQGAIVKQDGITLAEPGTPAARGEAIVIYCSGLGPVNPGVTAGQAAPASPLSTVVNPTSVTIGGQPAQLLFAGLTPGFSGLYQINAIIPAAAPAGDSVAVVIEVAGQRSVPVTIAIR